LARFVRPSLTSIGCFARQGDIWFDDLVPRPPRAIIDAAGGSAAMDGIKRCCANCHQSFRADSRNAWHQRYCTAPECRAASKSTSQRQWLAKPENRDYFRGPENVQRVQQWRQAHPGYSRQGRANATSAAAPPPAAGPTPPAATPLQELAPTQVTDAQEDFALAAAPAGAAAACPASPPLPLQDLLQQQPVVLIGLLAHLSASTLQDDIALAGRRLLQLGHDVLGGVRA
jgi:hypothetical protein